MHPCKRNMLCSFASSVVVIVDDASEHIPIMDSILFVHSLVRYKMWHWNPLPGSLVGAGRIVLPDILSQHLLQAPPAQEVSESRSALGVGC
jgi:hypothetical protein